MNADTHADDVMNRRLVLRALAKALILFVLFNGIYFLLQPVQNGSLPTLYNTFVPGRLRLEAGYEYAISRLVHDHVIQSARSDHYNIVMLGSSETWGAFSKSNETVPMYLNSLSLVTADGRPVAVYNLAYPGPDILKDLLIWETIRAGNAPVNLVISSVNHLTFSRTEEQQLLTANGAAVLEILAWYGLPSAMLIETPRAVPSFFWQDREDLAAFFRSQMMAPSIAFTQEDRELTSVPSALTAFFESNTMPPETRPGVLEALADSTTQAGIPLLLVSVPEAYNDHPFGRWIVTQAEQNHLALLNCTSSLDDPGLFHDSTHLTTEAHRVLAQMLATSLSDPATARIGAGLPLSGVTEATAACDFHPAPER